MSSFHIVPRFLSYFQRPPHHFIRHRPYCSNLSRSFSTSRSPMSSDELSDSYLVSPSVLAQALSRSSSTTPAIVPLCASWFLPTHPLTGLQTFQQSRIPGARFFDLDKVKDHSSPYPHMLPSPAAFAQAMNDLGISRDDRVVVYDSKELGLFSAPRVGWMFRVMGHPRVNILNSFKKWVQDGHPVETGPLQPPPGKKASEDGKEYPVPELDKSQVIGFEEVKAIATESRSLPSVPSSLPQILDARPHARFAGAAPEPRPGLPSGHIPNSVSVPFSSLLDQDSGTLLPAPMLIKTFRDNGVNPDRPVVSSCGTGVTAAIVDLALEEAGYLDEGADEKGKRKIYDGSWTEWAMRVKDGGAKEEETWISKGG